MENFIRKISPFLIIAGLIASVFFFYNAIQNKELVDKFVNNFISIFISINLAYVSINIYSQKITDKKHLNKIKAFLIFLLLYTAILFMVFLYYAFKNGLGSDAKTLFLQIFGLFMGIAELAVIYAYIPYLNKKIKS